MPSGIARPESTGETIPSAPCAIRTVAYASGMWWIISTPYRMAGQCTAMPTVYGPYAPVAMATNSGSRPRLENPVQ
jgi:hypothetical protein